MAKLTQCDFSLTARMKIYLSPTNTTVGQYYQPISAYHRYTSIDVYVFYMHSGNFLKRLWCRKRCSRSFFIIIPEEVYCFSHLKHLCILPHTTFFFSLVRLNTHYTQYTHVVVYYNTITNSTEGCRQQDKRLLNKTVVWEILHQSADNETTLGFHWISELGSSTEG